MRSLNIFKLFYVGGDDRLIRDPGGLRDRKVSGGWKTIVEKTQGE